MVHILCRASVIYVSVIDIVIDDDYDDDVCLFIQKMKSCMKWFYI